MHATDKGKITGSKFLIILPTILKMKKAFLVLFISVIGLASMAQTMEVGPYGGVSYYLGDLNPGVHFMSSKPAYGVIARVNFNPRISVRGGFYRGHVAGDDMKSQVNENRDLNFKSPITDISVVGEFNFFEYFTGTKRDRLSPYIFAGVGICLFNPESDGVKLKDIGTEGQNVGFDGRKPYKLVSFSVPFGIGVKFSLNSRFGLTAEWGMRKTFTDYIDDVSTTYYLDGSQINSSNVDEVLSDPTMSHDPYMERGNPATNDWYNFTGLTLTYKFKLFGGRKCYDQIRKGTN
jgi:Domain of unknown function (DUF6089)